MERLRDRKPLLVVGASAVLAAPVLLVALSWGSPVRSAPAPPVDRPTVERVPRDLPEELETGTLAIPAARALVSATAPAETIEAEASGELADPSQGYEQAIRSYVEALDASASREFEAGRFVWHEQGMPLPPIGSDEIVSVRRAWEGRYRVARMGEAEYPELHRLRADVAALAELIEAH